MSILKWYTGVFDEVTDMAQYQVYGEVNGEILLVSQMRKCFADDIVDKFISRFNTLRGKWIIHVYYKGSRIRLFAVDNPLENPHLNESPSTFNERFNTYYKPHKTGQEARKEKARDTWLRRHTVHKRNQEFSRRLLIA
jgi:hypothetical protein